MATIDNNNNLTFDKNALKTSKDNVIEFSDDKMGEMNRAIREKLLLLGEEYTDANGIKADWAHFDFLLTVYGSKYTKDYPNRLTLLKVFWGDLWQYLDPFVKSYEQLSENWYQTTMDMDDMLTNHAELKIKVDFFEEYVAKHMPKKNQNHFKRWFAQKKRELELKVESIQAQEVKRKEAEKEKK